MDWGTTFIFVLSIIGAVLLAEGDTVIGIIAFFVVFLILGAIKGIIAYFMRKEEPPYPPKASAKSCISLNEERFMVVHNQVMEFLNAYSAELPNEWYHYYISQEFEHSGDTTEGYVKFQIMLGSWWESLLYNVPEIKDYMMSIFTFDPSENTFTYRMWSGTCSGCSYPTNEITKMVHKYVSNYEAEHPGMRFERYSWGAKYSTN